MRSGFEADLLAPPLRTLAGIFDENAAILQLLAKLIGQGKVTIPARFIAAGNKRLNLVILGERFVQRWNDGETTIHFGKPVENRRPIVVAHLAFVECDIAGTNQIKYGRKRLGRIEIVVQAFFEVVARLRDNITNLGCVPRRKRCIAKTEQEFLDAIQRTLLFLETCKREVQLLPILHRQQQITNRLSTEAFLQQISQRIEVAFGLRHLLVLDKQMLCVDPKTRERFRSDAFTLGDFVFVMWKDQIHGAAVEIQRLAEVLHCHCGAFQVPARAARAERRFPARFLFVLRRFPENKIIRLFLVVLIRIDASADFQFTTIQPGQAAVSRKARNAKVDGIALVIRVAAREKSLDQLNHLRNVLGRYRDDVGFLYPQAGAVFEEGSSVRRCIGPNIDAFFSSTADDLVVDIRDVHHMLQVPLTLQMTTQDIFKNEGSKVSNMSEIVNSRTACIHPNGGAIGGTKRL